MIEPFFAGWLPPMSRDIWANRVSGVLAGCLMIVGGVVLASFIVVTWQTKAGQDPDR